MYRAFKGQCFFTGRPVPEKSMVIDHLIPKSKGGKDSFDNYVLTFSDLNAGKSNKLDDELERMVWTVKNVFAPRVKKLYEKFSNTIREDFYIQVEDEEVKFEISKFKTRVKPPENLVHIKNEGLFWVRDNKIQIYTTLNGLSLEKSFEAIGSVKSYANDARENDSDYCSSAYLNDEDADNIKSIWFCVDGSYLKAIKNIEYYENDVNYHWADIYFTRQYLEFSKWHYSTTELMSAIFEIEDHEKYEKALGLFSRLYPQPSP